MSLIVAKIIKIIKHIIYNCVKVTPEIKKQRLLSKKLGLTASN
jgi:hypothetical protein